MQTRSSDEISVCLSVCLSVRVSVKRVHCDKTEETYVHISIPCERSFSLVFWEEEWLYLKFWVTGPRWREIADFEPIFARSASAVSPSVKSVRAFQWACWSSYIRCPSAAQGGGWDSKQRNGRYRFKVLRLKKVCYKVSLCENCQRQSCKAFIGLTIRAKWLLGCDPFYLKILVKRTAFIYLLWKSYTSTHAN